MADVIGLSTSSFHSSSLLTSFTSTLNARKPSLGPNNFKLDRESCNLSSSSSFADVYRFPFTSRKQLLSFKVHATMTETSQPKWWERNAGPNMIDIHSTEEFLSALNEAGDRLVIVEFYGTWCASCRALFPKFQKMKDAIEMHSRPCNYIFPSERVGDLSLESVSTPIEIPAVST